MGERTSYTPGTFSWVDLQTTDQDAAKAFYGDLLGWDIEEIAPGEYWSIANGGNRNGGIMPMPPGSHPAWNLYFAVDDVDATVARAREGGGDAVAEVAARLLERGVLVHRDDREAAALVRAGVLDHGAAEGLDDHAQVAIARALDRVDAQALDRPHDVA